MLSEPGIHVKLGPQSSQLWPPYLAQCTRPAIDIEELSIRSCSSTSDIEFGYKPTDRYEKSAFINYLCGPRPRVCQAKLIDNEDKTHRNCLLPRSFSTSRSRSKSTTLSSAFGPQSAVTEHLIEGAPWVAITWVLVPLSDWLYTFKRTPGSTVQGRRA